MWAIIGGSGFEHFEGFEVLEPLDIITPFGKPSSGLKKVGLQGESIIFISRHGQYHELLPSEINYRANIFALKQLGVNKILSISAVGSLRQELKPGDMVIPYQYLNRTTYPRQHTFCGNGVTGHVSLANPITNALAEEVQNIKHLLDFDIHFNKTYVCIDGPYFSTRSESNHFRQMNADIIGMTNFPEYALAREAGICYLPCSFVTDYDCWDDSIPHVTVEQVMQVMRQNNAKAFKLATTLIPYASHLFPQGCAELGLKSGLMRPLDTLPSDKRRYIETLLA
jgi:5'-methylthioadenosine phosphorylase